MKPLSNGVIKVTVEKGYTYVTYKGQKKLLSGCPTPIRNQALKLIAGAK